ncbi:hypothetical protein [Taibaiella helva]|uniref:hypothetical protein n=1 Tax=Taibaiella helva TaxID=2301235 RepID=UPI000E583965|nr:hypothetical protein [Taibaiella helva]
MRILILILLSGLFTTYLYARENRKPPEATVHSIRGDFDGDGRIDSATVVHVKEGRGNPVEDGTPDEYEIRFPGSSTLKPVKAGCCSLRLVNEGDLDDDGADELSLVQAPMNGCTYPMKTCSFTHGAWRDIVPLFLVPTGCSPVSEEALQQRVSAEKGSIYYLDTDGNDENGELIRKKVSARTAKKINPPE